MYSMNIRTKTQGLASFHQGLALAVDPTNCWGWRSMILPALQGCHEFERWLPKKSLINGVDDTEADPLSFHKRTIENLGPDGI